MIPVKEILKPLLKEGVTDRVRLRPFREPPLNRTLVLVKDRISGY